jgi:hypothetical protein
VAASPSQTYEYVDRADGTEIQEQEGLGSSVPIKDNGGYNSAGTSQTETEDREIIDPIISKEQWDTLFSKPAPPRCEHGEPCTKLQTKIKGVNSGRHFWICARYVPSNFSVFKLSSRVKVSQVDGRQTQNNYTDPTPKPATKFLIP